MEGHTLVTTQRHAATLLDLSVEEEAALGVAVARTGRAIRAAFDPDGILVQQNNGEAAYQTVPHVHFHVIPMRRGSPFPPDHTVEITPTTERVALARRLRERWDVV